MPDLMPSAAVEKAGFSKSLDDCDHHIRAVYFDARNDFRAMNPDLDLKVDYTYRSPALQFELFKKGRALDQASGQWVLTDRTQRVTDKDGVNSKSEHNYYPSRAADIYITRGDKILWPSSENNALYIELGHIWELHGLVSGAIWKFAWKDMPHVQVA